MLNRKDFDWSQFDAYRAQNLERDECDNSFENGSEVLHIWEEQKSQYLAKLFPEHQLVLERPIRYERSADEMRRQMFELVDEFNQFQYTFREKLTAVMDPERRYGSTYLTAREWNTYSDYNKNLLIMESIYRWFNVDVLMENTIQLPRVAYGTYLTRYELDIMGHKLMLQNGMKLMKTLGKLCDWLGMANEFEEFRIRQSQVTNAKIINGTACLSIHPLDYATASDNENGWSSCMSWQEHGCYRMGTVEMMNSPMVLCSYIKSDKQQMTINDQEWNSKKWRAWIIVTPEVIMVNRHYPYHSPEISHFMVDWVRELVEANLNWHYDPEIYDDLLEKIQDMANYHEIDEITCFETNFMYNDVGDDDVGIVSNDPAVLRRWRRYINFSGPAQCMWCGEWIDFDNNQDQADRLGCRCPGMYVCSDCGCTINEEDVYYGPNGEVWCADCWAEHCSTCDKCGDTDYNEHMTNVIMPWNIPLQKQYFNKHRGDRHNEVVFSMMRPWDDSWRSLSTEHMCVCRTCMEQLKEKVKFVRFEDLSDTWTESDSYCELVPDARVSDFKTFMDFIQPRHYRLANAPYTWEDYTKEEREHMIDFYREQWQKLAADQSQAEMTYRHRFNEPVLTLRAPANDSVA